MLLVSPFCQFLDLTCCGTIGLGDFDVFGDAVIEDVEDVVVVVGDGPDDG